jgi:hypothetical protein
MELANLKMPPFNTTLMGVVKGALACYGSDLSPAMAFGGSGHAFLINIHEDVCPSGPYVWKNDRFQTMLRNLGLETVFLGFFHSGSTPAERAAVEQKLRDNLAQGLPCSLCNLENQLICGHDEQRFFTAQPWPKNPDYPPKTLTFGTWAEFGSECHVSFFSFKKLPAQDRSIIIRDSLSYALDLFQNPRKYSCERYGIGPEAYDNWLKAVETGKANPHGNWWNATVWSECRGMAAAFFAEIAEDFPDNASVLRSLSAAYKEISDGLARVGDKKLPNGAKPAIVRDLKTRELAAISRVRELADSLA